MNSNDDLIRETVCEINRAQIREPRDEEFVARCHFSRTGWAIWRLGDRGSHYCICTPALPPQDEASGS